MNIPHISHYQFTGKHFVLRNTSLRRALILCIMFFLFLSVLVPSPANSRITPDPERPTLAASPIEEAVAKEHPLLPAAMGYIAKSNKDLTTDATKMIATAVLEHSAQFKVDPILTLALIKVESGFNPDAISPMGAKGLTQVIPKWHMAKIEEARGKFNVYSIFEPNLNIYVGIKAFREMLDASGGITNALLMYNGSLGDSTKKYANAVLVEYKRATKVLTL